MVTEIGWPSAFVQRASIGAVLNTRPVTRMSLILYRGKFKGNRATRLGVV